MANKLKAVIVHYHLRTGGVRRVIDGALTALAGSGVSTAVIAGESPQDARPLPGGTAFAIVPELQYNSGPGPGLDGKIAESLVAAARRLLGGDPDLWHFHNHSLGKNPALPPAVRRLAEDGFPVLLQIHDFPEDGRPGLYGRLLAGAADTGKLGRLLYPVAGHVHYALINSRDTGFIRACGSDAAGTHLLPNPASMAAAHHPPAAEARAASPGLVLYPTRAIRRKNVGEVLLWAAAAGGDLRFGLTRSPKNPEHQPVYDRWVHFSARLGLPLEFGMGERQDVDFEELFASAGSIITTSIAEGFGLCFLEPFLAGRALCGRDLPEITADFTSRGIDLAGLYEKLLVPLGPGGEKELKDRVAEGMEGFYRSYGREPAAEHVEAAMESFVEDGMVDFGRLDEPMQERIIARVRDNPSDRKLLKPGRLLKSPGDAIGRNRQMAEKHFSIESYGRRLGGLYAKVAASDASGRVGSLDAARLLDCFLAPERFSLLKT